MKKIILIALTSFSMTLHAQTDKKLTTQFGGNLTYHIPTWDKSSTKEPFLFLQGGQSAGLELALIPAKSKFAIKTNANFFVGQNDKTEPFYFANKNNIEFTKYEWSSKTPFGFNLMAGPRYMIASQNKKTPIMYLDIQGGGLFTNGQSIKYSYQNNVTAEYKTNKSSFAYGANFTIVPLITKKLMFRINAGYTNYGGFGIGLAIADRICNGAPCCRCDGGGCNPCATESSNSLNK